MNLKYRVVIIVSVLLLTLSIGTSILNYVKSLNQMEKQLKDISIPLSINNIYTEVQKNVIEPNLISSMMANDTFLKDWLIHEENNVDKISKYLDSIRNKYNLLNTFLVSDKSNSYYTSKGFLEKIDEKIPEDAWYFKFKNIQEKHEINLDINKNIDNSMIMFINYKIFDDNYHYLGATGVAIKTVYIDKMLKNFRKKYNFNVYFINSDGKVIISETGVNKLANINNIKELSKYKKEILDFGSKTLEYEVDDKKFILNSKYIEELGLYLIVELKVDNFIKDVRDTFYLNLIFSLFVTVIIIFIILYTIINYNHKLEFMANNDSLTALPNRRSFNENFKNALLLFNRNKYDKSIIFFDIDDFKNINDSYSHLTGDKVLTRIGQILKNNVRKTDDICRWGGEEFSILCQDSSLENTKKIAEKIRSNIEFDDELNFLVKKGVTASFGITSFKKDDDYDSIITRVDLALYKAKENGKNQVIIK